MEKPILFNTAMVQAILKGDKTSTRRPMKPQPTSALTSLQTLNKMPYNVGDVIYVRETWCMNPYATGWPYDYKASPEFWSIEEHIWRPSIHMPKAAARLLLKVTDVRVEMIRATTAGDCVKEGIKLDYPITSVQSADEYIYEFRKLWDGIYNNWKENPWVWVIEFEKVEGR